VAEERGQLQHRRALPGAGAVGPRAELLEEDFSTRGQVGACGGTQCSEPGARRHFFGWVLPRFDVQSVMPQLIEIDV